MPCSIVASLESQSASLQPSLLILTQLKRHGTAHQGKDGGDGREFPFACEAVRWIVMVDMNGALSAGVVCTVWGRTTQCSTRNLSIKSYQSIRSTPLLPSRLLPSYHRTRALYSLKKSCPAHLKAHICPICKFLQLLVLISSVFARNQPLGSLLPTGTILSSICTPLQHLCSQQNSVSAALACFPPKICSRRLNLCAESRTIPTALRRSTVVTAARLRLITAYLRYQSIRAPFTRCSARWLPF